MTTPFLPLETETDGFNEGTRSFCPQTSPYELPKTGEEQRKPLLRECARGVEDEEQEGTEKTLLRIVLWCPLGRGAPQDKILEGTVTSMALFTEERGGWRGEDVS